MPNRLFSVFFGTFLKKNLHRIKIMRTFAPVQRNEGLTPEPLILLFNKETIKGGFHQSPL